MQSSNKRVNKTLEKQMYEMLFQLLAEVKTKQEIKILLEDLLFEGELAAMAKRLAIMVYLDKGRSYENIEENIKVSSATIATVAERMASPGTQEALRRVKAEEWAETTSERVINTLRGVGLVR